MSAQNLLDQLLGPGTGAKAQSTLQNSGVGGIAGGLAAGGLLGLLVGNKKARKKVGKLAGGVVGYGGAAALGALAYRAYNNWQSNKAAPAQTAPPQPQALPPPEPPPAGSAFDPAAAPAADGQAFELALVKAMIAAANADGHIDATEQKAIFDQVGQLPLEASDKAVVFDTLGNPPGLGDIAAMARGPEQAAELYLVSRFAIDPDHPAEQAYLEGLAARLGLDPALVDQLNAEVAAAQA